MLICEDFVMVHDIMKDCLHKRTSE